MKNKSVSDVQLELNAIRQKLADLEAKLVSTKKISPPRAKRFTRKVSWFAGALLISGIVFAAGEALFIDNSGNVGIGTNTPSAKLDVIGEVKAQQLDVRGEVKAQQLSTKKLSVAGDYFGKGELRLSAWGGANKSGTAYVQARDASATTDIALQLRTQKSGKIKNALKIDAGGKVSIPGPLTAGSIQTKELSAPGMIAGGFFLVKTENSATIKKCEAFGSAKCPAATNKEPTCKTGETLQSGMRHYCEVYPLGKSYCYLSFCISG